MSPPRFPSADAGPVPGEAARTGIRRIPLTNVPPAPVTEPETASASAIQVDSPASPSLETPPQSRGCGSIRWGSVVRVSQLASHEGLCRSSVAGRVPTPVLGGGHGDPVPDSGCRGGRPGAYGSVAIAEDGRVMLSAFDLFTAPVCSAQRRTIVVEQIRPFRGRW